MKQLCRFPFAEVLVIDDGSATALQMETPSESRSSLRILRCAENIGLAAARNHVLQNVAADWILFVDSDVVPFDRFLETLPARLQAATTDGLGFAVREYHRRSDWDFFRACERDSVTRRGRVEWLSGLLCVYRAEALRAISGFNPAFRSNGEDVDLGYRLSLVGRTLIQIPEVSGEHHRKDTLRSFLRMHYRYAVTAKRVARWHYFAQPGNEISRRLPAFHWRSIGPQLRLFLQFLVRRPYAFYLPPLVAGAMFLGAFAGRKQCRVRGAGDLSPEPRMNLATQ